MIEKTLSFIKKHKALTLLSIGTFILIIISYLFPTGEKRLLPTLVPKTASPTPTVLLPTPTTILNIDPLTDPQQKITFNWNGLNIDQYKQINIYHISTSLINPVSIANIAGYLNLKSADRQSTLKPNNYRWLTNEQNLFASIPQDQIFYSRTSIAPTDLTPLDSTSVLQSINNHLSTMLGAKASKLLSSSPEIRYYRYYFSNNSTSPKITTTTAEKATVYEASFRQQIDNFPVVALSGIADIVTIGIDRNRQITHFNIYGGIDSYVFDKVVPSITTDDLKRTAPQKAKRITSGGSVGIDNSYTSATKLTLSVTKIEPAYLQENVSLHPVYLLYVDMSGPNLPAIPAIFSISALPQD